MCNDENLNNNNIINNEINELKTELKNIIIKSNIIEKDRDDKQKALMCLMASVMESLKMDSVEEIKNRLKKGISDGLESIKENNK